MEFIDNESECEECGKIAELFDVNNMNVCAECSDIYDRIVSVLKEKINTTEFKHEYEVKAPRKFECDTCLKKVDQIFTVMLKHYGYDDCTDQKANYYTYIGVCSECSDKVVGVLREDYL